MPQTAIMARFFLIYAVLFHLTRQVVTRMKKVNVDTDTIQSVRKRNNKQYAFHMSLNFLSDGLLATAQKEIEDEELVGGGDIVKNLNRYNSQHANKRYKTDCAVLGGLEDTGVTPFGKEKVKLSLKQKDNYQEYKNRCDNCACYTVRLFKPKVTADGKINSFSLGKRCCDLCVCGTRVVSWVCTGCKRVICVDKDRSEAILKHLQHKDDGPKLRERFPLLANLSKGNVHAFYTDIGVINNNQIFGGMSCFHIAHPAHFSRPSNPDDVDGQH